MRIGIVPAVYNQHHESLPLLRQAFLRAVHIGRRNLHKDERTATLSGGGEVLFYYIDYSRLEKCLMVRTI